MKYSLSISFLVLMLFFASGCSSLKEGVWLHSTPYAFGGIPSSYNHNEEITMFDFILTRKKDSIEGLVVVKSEGEDHKRIVMTSFFGMTFLDFELSGKNIKINYCIEQLNREKVILLLKKDFEILFKPDHSPFTKYVFNADGKIGALQQGNGITRTLMYFIDYQDGYPNEVIISHPWLGIKLQMTKSERNED
ncbi:MAG: hypothetical protein PHV46_06170 [Bacteroidales bacterium]|jgi:hypothetical protein|nr:hypothetical protein [Bacteroidales bacterium]